MNFAKLEAKKPLIILSAIMIALNTIICINLSLADEFVYFLAFLAIGIAVSSWMATINGNVVVTAAFAVGIAVSTFIVPSPFTVIRAISPLPFAFSLRAVLKNKISRSSAIALSSAIFTVTVCAYFALYAANDQGYLSTKSIIDSFPSFFDELTEIICSSSEIKVAGEYVPSITPEGAQKYLVALIGIFPGIIFFLVSITGYIGALLFKKIIKLTTGLHLTTSSWALKTAFPTALTFILALLVTSLSSSLSVFTLAALNICIIFFPVLFMTGLNSAFEPKIVNGYRMMKIFRILILFILVLYNVFFFAFACAFFAIYDSIKSIIPKRNTKE